MIRIKFSMRPYIKGSTGQVGIKVRWNQSKSEVSFFTNVWAEPDKWNQDLLRAKKGTTHYVRDMRFTYTEINEAIAEYRQEIESVFDKCALRNSVPTVDELKTMVNYALGRVDAQATYPIAVQKKKTFKEMVDLFLDECGKEKNWDDQAKEKYTQENQAMMEQHGLHLSRGTIDNYAKKYFPQSGLSPAVNTPAYEAPQLDSWQSNTPSINTPDYTETQDEAPIPRYKVDTSYKVPTFDHLFNRC